MPVKNPGANFSLKITANQGFGTYTDLTGLFGYYSLTRN